MNTKATARNKEIALINLRDASIDPIIVPVFFKNNGRKVFKA